ncbi:MAG TPA: 6-phosphofructokinase [Aggregatilineales bacterium]|nr:6-phosphofructokinase [Aggregatilineales bacterium]
MATIQRVAILTSGGDAPGMNAAIRALTRVSLAQGWEVFGVQEGYRGLVEDNLIPLDARRVGGIIQLGGTMLGSARCLEFKTEDGRKKALANLERHGIHGLFVIGGNGSQTGANTLYEMGFPVNGVASTIDNDLVGSDITIGVDTALNIALESIDRLKVTASSHRRAFLVEVMGRDCGYLALMAGIAGGAEMIVIPEIETTPQQIAETIRAAYKRGKSHALVVVAEGAKHNTDALIDHFKTSGDDLGFEMRALTLGHVQRGGAPFAFDRTLAARLGAMAVEAMANGQYGVLAGSKGGQMITTPLKEIAGKTKGIDPNLLRLADILAQ